MMTQLYYRLVFLLLKSVGFGLLYALEECFGCVAYLLEFVDTLLAKLWGHLQQIMLCVLIHNVASKLVEALVPMAVGPAGNCAFIALLKIA